MSSIELWLALASGGALAAAGLFAAARARGAARAATAARVDLEQKLAAAEAHAGELKAQMSARTETLEQRNRELGEAVEKLRRAQDDIIRNEKLASMGRLVAGVAHEVNNPMNAVLNTLDPLEEALGRVKASGHREAAAAGDEALQMLAVLRRGATRTKAIVQALHNYSRGDTETLTDVNVLRAIDDTLDILRHRLRQIQVEKAIDPAARVAGFAGQIDQVLMNLLTNAVQAIGDRPGTIRIGLHRHGGPASGEVVLTVTDDGKGIPPEVLPRIFDPFFTTKDVGEGAGLGLSIVHGIVERHGGRIEVASEGGRRTTFRVFLPGHAGLAAALNDVTARRG